MAKKKTDSNNTKVSNQGENIKSLASEIRNQENSNNLELLFRSVYAKLYSRFGTHPSNSGKPEFSMLQIYVSIQHNIPIDIVQKNWPLFTIDMLQDEIRRAIENLSHNNLLSEVMIINDSHTASRILAEAVYMKYFANNT